MGVTHGFYQLLQRDHCQSELMGTDPGQNKGRLSDFLDFTGQDSKT